MNRASWNYYDPILIGAALVSTLLGLLFIFDAGYARSLANGQGHLPPEFKSQLIYLGPALLAGFVVSRISGDRWLKLSKVVWIVSLALLVGVELFGATLNGAKRWLDIGPVHLQPAEFAKVATVIYLAGCFANRSAWPKREYKDWADYLDRCLVPKLARCMPLVWVLLSVYLIEKEPDLGTAAVVGATAFALLVPAGVSKMSLLAGLVIAFGGAGLLAWKEPYRVERILNHDKRWSQQNIDDIGYQTVQSELAMANGGVLGVGIGAGRAKHVMPATTTDFVMATVGEEFGLAGALIVLGAIGALVWRMLWLAQRAASRFKMLVLYGIASWIGIQTCVNVLMANGTLPAIGIPLPFISSGGSSLVALWIGVGLCQAMLMPEPVREESVEPSRNRRRNRRTHLSGARGSASGRRTRREPEISRIPTGPRV